MLHNGVHLPDWEGHLQKMLDEYPKVNGKATYQFRKLETVMKLSSVGNVVDVGAHVGLWSMHLVDYFEKVYAFEPVSEYRKLFRKNVVGNWTLYPYACGDETKLVGTEHPNVNSGHTYIVDGTESRMVRLDDMSLKDIAMMKFDCEGYEYFAIKGGEKLIKEYKPAIIVEQKPQNKDRYGLSNLKAVDLLKSWGAKLRGTDCGDYILSWD